MYPHQTQKSSLAKACRRAPLLATVGLVIAGLLAAAAPGAPSDLDLSFGDGGLTTVSFAPNTAGGADVAVQPDGKIVVAGTAADVPPNPPIGIRFALARLNTNGSLDESFGTGGKVTTEVGPSGSSVGAVMLQPDGKIVAGGGALGNALDFALVRYNPDGSVDQSFQTVLTDYGDNESVQDLALQADGKIIAVGGYNSFSIARYNSDGSLDQGFGTGGKVNLHPGSRNLAHAVVVQPDGRIVVGGYTGENLDRPALVRMNADGSLDQNFGLAGLVVSSTIQGSINALSLDPDGKIVGGGAHVTPSNESGFGLYRFNPDGSFDQTFGSDGTVFTRISGASTAFLTDIALQPDGMIIAVGMAFPPDFTSRFAVARYNPDGSIEGTFGAVMTSFPSGPSVAYGVALQADGKIVSAGVAGDPSTFALARYTAGPPVDTTAPVLDLPADIFSVSPADGASVSFQVTATDNVDLNPEVVCTPTSGSHFPVGTTTVNCTATDAAGNVSSGSFRITLVVQFAFTLSVIDVTLAPQENTVMVRGRVVCNQAGSVQIFGLLEQVTGNKLIQGSFFTALDCSPTASQWAATVTQFDPSQRYRLGKAAVTVEAGGCDSFSCNAFALQSTSTKIERR